MSHEIENFLNYIQLDLVLKESSSVFPDLVGYYETISTVTSADDSLNVFFKFLENRLESCRLISSLTDFVEHAQYWTETEKRLVADLENKGWLVRNRRKDETSRNYIQELAIFHL